MNSVTLYECTASIRAVLDAEYESEKEAHDTLDAVVGQFDVKAQNVAAAILNDMAMLDMLDKHIRSIQDKKKVLENKIKRWESYLKSNMEVAGITEIKADNGTFSAKIVKNPPSVDVYDMTLLDPAYIREKISHEPDKTAIKAALQNGKNIQGARLIKDKTSLRIR